MSSVLACWRWGWGAAHQHKPAACCEVKVATPSLPLPAALAPTICPLLPVPLAGVCKTDSAGKPLSIAVMIADECPECGTDHIDVQSLAFAKVSGGGRGLEGGQGRVAVRAQQAGGRRPGVPLAAVQAAPSLLRSLPSSRAPSHPLLCPLSCPTLWQMADPGIGRIKVQYRRIQCLPPDDMKVSGSGVNRDTHRRLEGSSAAEAVLSRLLKVGSWGHEGAGPGGTALKAPQLSKHQPCTPSSTRPPHLRT